MEYICTLLHMPMKKHLFLFTIACLLTALLPGCHTSQEATSSRSALPKFISNIYISPHNKTGATVDAIDHKKYPQKPKTASRQQHTDTKTTVASKVVPANAPQCTEPVPNTKEPNNVVRKKYADLLKVDDRTITNFTLYQFIDKWIGTDYRIGGCDISGIDCSGFAQKLYSEVYGIDLLRTATEQFVNCKRIKNAKEALEGDLVFFHIRSRRISHVGIYLGNNYFVHASTSNGVMISNLDEEYWHKYYAGCGRIPRG